MEFLNTMSSATPTNTAIYRYERTFTKYLFKSTTGQTYTPAAEFPHD